MLCLDALLAECRQVLYTSPQFGDRTYPAPSENRRTLINHWSPTMAKHLRPLPFLVLGLFAGYGTALAQLPVIATNGVVNGASGLSGVQSGSWMTIFGTNLSSTT